MQVAVPKPKKDAKEAPKDPGTDYDLVPAYRPITIRDLLTHTSGLCYRFKDHPLVGRLYAEADRRRDAITKAAGYQTFRFQSKQKPSEAEIAALFHPAPALE